MNNNLFCFGYGYTARVLAQRLLKKGWSVAGTARSDEKAATIETDGGVALRWNGGAIDPHWIEDATHILISTPPDNNGCPAFTAAGRTIAKHAAQLKWIGYLSTNGVYGDHDGAWIDETAALKPTSDRARRRIRAENEWARFAKTHGLPLIIFRLPGIYGPGRSALDAVRQGKARRVYKKGQVFNRIHVDDIAAALTASMKNPGVHALYNLADDEPAPPQDVIDYACRLLDIQPPPLVPLEQAGLSDMAISFYTDNKRVSNKRMKDALGVTLTYPTYRDGLRAIMQTGSGCV